MSHAPARRRYTALWHRKMNSAKSLPSIGITMGDAAGIGPEIIVKALADPSLYEVCQPIVIGSAAIIEDALRFVPTERGRKVRTIATPSQASVPAHRNLIDVLDVSSLSPSEVAAGSIDARAGAAAVKAIETATQLALEGQLAGIATAPICKASIQRAGSPYPGHTEMLAALTRVPTSVMMLQSEQLTVSFVTNHIPLAEVPKHLSVESVVDVVCITQEALIRWGIPSPRLVVAGLNPHAGEEGMFGKEEQQVIIPAIARLTFKVDGPLPADTLFVKACRGEWDAVIAIYHDQGNIPIKLLAFGEIVNITLGLPIVRTSVDHGTAFDIAGKGVASEMSLIAAIKCAARLSAQK